MKATACLLLPLWLMAQESSLPKASERSRVMNQDPSVDFFDSVADYFRTSQRAVLAINQKGIPPEEVPAVLTIARKSSASANEVIDLKKSGKQWAEIAKTYKVDLGGDNFVEEANILFLSEYHGRPIQEVKAMRTKGTTFVAINQDLRRNGSPMPRRTAK